MNSYLAICNRYISPLHNPFCSICVGQFYGYLEPEANTMGAFLLFCLRLSPSYIVLRPTDVCAWGRVEVKDTPKPSLANEGKMSVDNFTRIHVFQYDNSEVASTRLLRASPQISKEIDFSLVQINN